MVIDRMSWLQELVDLPFFRLRELIPAPVELVSQGLGAETKSKNESVLGHHPAEHGNKAHILT